VSPKLPGCPEWCPANHFGYLQAGTMKVQYKDGSTETVNAGSSYNIPPGVCV
jgi:quercetin dioxygenase-like cupin family protein